MPFKKGVSPNPKGRPKRGHAKGEFDFNGECRKKGKELFDRLIKLSKLAEHEGVCAEVDNEEGRVVLDDKVLAIGLKATAELIAYGYAKPKQQLELADSDGSPLELIVRVKTDVK